MSSCTIFNPTVFRTLYPYNKSPREIPKDPTKYARFSSYFLILKIDNKGKIGLPRFPAAEAITSKNVAKIIKTEYTFDTA